MRKTVVKKVYSYEWVVEDLCAACQPKCEAEAPVVESGANVSHGDGGVWHPHIPPIAPEAAARIIHGKPAADYNQAEAH